MKTVKAVLAVVLLACVLCAAVLAVPSATITEEAAARYEEAAFAGEE